MPRVKMKDVKSRLGSFSVIRMGGAVIITPCDTRTKIIGALARRHMTSEEVTRLTGMSYSTVMDHMDALERVGIVSTYLKRDGGKNGGRRRIYFSLSDDPLGAVDELFDK